MKNIFKLLLIFTFSLSLGGCASIAKKWKSLVGGGSSDEKNLTEDGKPIPPTSFTNNPNYGSYKERNYKKVTKENFNEDQGLEETSGSLWRQEGQGSFLFSQNSLRVTGDIINVELEGKAVENLNVKVDLIKKAQERLAVPSPKNSREARIPRPDERAAANVPSPAPQTTEGNTQQAGDAKAITAETTGDDAEKQAMKFDPVPCRIIEKNPDGSYRVKGVQVVYVGKKEFKLMVTGSVRPDDISSEAVNSSRLIDSRYDLVAKDGSR
ncbi:MAG: flagellar basal body L-ring protein FlgH [Oligoflexia bacterium]|nr:flagellar basal body L-ring protein FlgH [Oligoflexia bacterium]